MTTRSPTGPWLTWTTTSDRARVRNEATAAAYADGSQRDGHGVVMPFRRIFVVARKGDAA